MNRRKCSKCKISKFFHEFSKDSSRSDGCQRYCKVCDREARKSRAGRKYEVQSKKCASCELEKSSDMFFRSGYYADGLQTYCKTCMRRYIKPRENHYSAIRRSRKKQALMSWSEKEEIKALYREAERRGMRVDHVFPLKGDTVCGLHVLSNLQLLTPEENLMKRNSYPENQPESW